ncbi:MAG: hypothetical protein K8R87_08410 [Verrucomicrobia bacterium]|nr:hypothetical protein [Verrucomicrobiota bacterium]
MMPVTLVQSAQENIDPARFSVLFRPLDVFRQAHHFLEVGGVIPGGGNQRVLDYFREPQQ